MTKFLGRGAFGEVYEGCVKYPEYPETRVAIKTLRKGATEQEKAEFLQEAHLMSNFKHEHILRLIGVCLDLDPLYIIMELMQGGDLLSFLRQSRTSVVSILKNQSVTKILRIEMIFLGHSFITDPTGSRFDVC